MILKDVVAVANGEPPTLKHLLSQWENKTLVAIDGGLNFCDQHGIIPDLILGDFDSIEPSLFKKYEHVQKKYVPDQNKNDLEKALEFFFSFPVDSVTVFGALRKRLDQTLANLYLLSRYPVKVKFESDYEVCFVAKKRCEIETIENQVISLMPLGGPVTKIKTTGLKWELNGEDLNKSFFSISNVAIQKQITLSFESGDLLVCLSRLGPKFA